MGRDRKHMKKVRKKRIKSVGEQIERHEDMIENEQPMKDTTKAYWQKESDEKFSKRIEEDEEYMKEN